MGGKHPLRHVAAGFGLREGQGESAVDAGGDGVRVPAVHQGQCRCYIDQLRTLSETDPNRVVRIHSLGAIKAATTK